MSKTVKVSVNTLRSVNIKQEEELVSFDISALFTSIPVPTALDVINRLFTEHIEVPETRGKYNCSFEANTVGLNKNEGNGFTKISTGKLCVLFPR